MAARRAPAGVLVRYCDDFVICCPTRERAERARALAGAVLATLGLQLHPTKTGIAHLARGGQGFDFLGFHHQKVESWRHRGRFHLQRWPSQRAMGVLRDKIPRGDLTVVRWGAASSRPWSPT